MTDIREALKAELEANNEAIRHAKGAKREALAQMQANAAIGAPFAEQSAAVTSIEARLSRLFEERQRIDAELRKHPAPSQRPRLDWNDVLGELLDRTERIELKQAEMARLLAAIGGAE